VIEVGKTGGILSLIEIVKGMKDCHQNSWCYLFTAFLSELLFSHDAITGFPSVIFTFQSAPMAHRSPNCDLFSLDYSINTIWQVPYTLTRHECKHVGGGSCNTVF